MGSWIEQTYDCTRDYVRSSDLLIMEPGRSVPRITSLRRGSVDETVTHSNSLHTPIPIQSLIPNSPTPDTGQSAREGRRPTSWERLGRVCSAPGSTEGAVWSIRSDGSECSSLDDHISRAQRHASKSPMFKRWEKQTCEQEPWYLGALARNQGYGS